MNMVLKNGRVIDPVTGFDRKVDIRIVDGIIEKVSPTLTAGKDHTAIELDGKIIAPGFIDMHVHLREPGFEHKETIESGCRAAMAGGFTAVCCMPNTNPAIDDASVVQMIIERSRRVHDGLVDVYPIAAATIGRQGKILSPMMELAEAGAIGFTDDGSPIMDAHIMRRALEYAGMIDRPIIQHAEDISLTRGGAMNEGFVSTLLGLPAMPSIAENILVARDIHLVEFVRAPYHVAHISTASAVELVRDAKRRKLPVTCEVTPHHFTLTENAVRSFDTNTKMNPPLRTATDIEAIKEGLRDGTIDVIATDHAPHSFDEKQIEYVHAPFGIIGLETAIALTISELVVPGILSLSRLIEILSVNPRKILRLPPIRISEGEPANLTIIDPDVEWIVDSRSFQSKSKNTPFEGRKLRGKAFGVINNRSHYFAS